MDSLMLVDSTCCGCRVFILEQHNVLQVIPAPGLGSRSLCCRLLSPLLIDYPACPDSMKPCYSVSGCWVDLTSLPIP